MSRSFHKIGFVLLAGIVVFGAYFLLGAAAVQASPADPDLVKTVLQPDGTTVDLRLWGDEFAHGYATLDGYTVVKDVDTGYWEYATLDEAGELVPSGVVADQGSPPEDPHLSPSPEVVAEARTALGAPAAGEMWLASPPAWAGGDTDVVFIMVEFTDVACTFTDAQMETNLFGGGASGPGDVDDYFREISYGNLELDGRVEGDGSCYALANPHTDYDQGTNGQDNDTLVEQAIDLADGDIDFSEYDNDGDGYVDSLGIIYAGGGPHDGCETDDGAAGGSGDNLWPHSGTIPDKTVDGVKVSKYIIQSEVTWPLAPPSNCTVMQTAGLFVHEFGHALGLPDLYDTDGSSSGVGYWSTMASQYREVVNNADAPPHYDPWSKWWLGWITPQNYTGLDKDGPIPQVETTGFVVQLLANPGGAEKGGSGEYFLVENRQQVNFDVDLPGCGLLIWHMEESMTHNKNEGHTTAAHRLVDLEEADGLDDLDNKTNRGDTGDPYPGSTVNRLFDGPSYPTSNLYDGSPSGVRIANISDCDTVMYANFGNPTADVWVDKSTCGGCDGRMPQNGANVAGDSTLAGEHLYYYIRVGNNGPGVAEDVVVVDTLPSGVTYLEDTDSCVEGPTGTLTCSIGDLGQYESVEFTIKVLVDDDLVANAGGPTSILNTVTVTSDVPDENLTNNEDTVSVIVQAEADLRVFKDCKPDDPILVGEEAVCTITVQNLGPSVATAVTFRDLYVSDGPFHFGTLPGGCISVPVPGENSVNVQCAMPGSLPVGITWPTYIPVIGDAPQNINDHVIASSAVFDPDESNNWAEDEVNVYEAADLRITKFGKPDGEVRTGEVLTYTVIVDNLGPSPAVGVALKDILQSDGTFDLIDIVSDRDASCTLLLPEIGQVGPFDLTADPWPPDEAVPAAPDVNPPTGVAGIQERLEIDCTLDEDLAVLAADGPPNSGRWILTLRVRAYQTQDLNNVADVVAGIYDPNEENNHAEVLHEIIDVANLEVSKEAEGEVVQAGGAVVWTADEVTAGKEMKYTITVQNTGPSRAENVVVEDRLPPGIVVTGAVAAQGTCTTGTPGDPVDRLICDLGTLEDGASVVITINADVLPSVECPTLLENDVLVYSDMFDADQSDNRDHNLTEVSAWADLWVEKDQEPEIVLGGKEIYYKILVGNEGPSDSGWVMVHDIFPPELHNVTWQCTALGDAMCPNGESEQWGDGDTIQTVQLAVGWKLMFEVWATRHPVPDWEFTNEVWVATDETKGPGCVQDPNEGNNFDDVSNEPYMHFLPVIYNIRFDVALPDLIVKSMWAEPREVAVTVINTGPEEVKNPFYVEVYVGSASGPTGVNQHWRDLGSEGLLWYVHGDALPLGPGEKLMVRVTDEGGDEYYLAEETSSQVFWPIGPGTNVWAQVDSRTGPYGLVFEIHEWENQYYNNIKGPLSSHR